MAVCESITIYVNSADSLEDKIAKYDFIIDALQTTALTAAENQDIEEYWLDDGQTKIKTVYRDPIQITKAIQTYEMLRQRALNQLNGRVIRLVDHNSNSLNNC